MFILNKIMFLALDTLYPFTIYIREIYKPLHIGHAHVHYLYDAYPKELIEAHQIEKMRLNIMLINKRLLEPVIVGYIHVFWGEGSGSRSAKWAVGCCAVSTA